MFWRLLFYTNFFLILSVMFLSVQAQAIDLPRFKPKSAVIQVHGSCHYWRHQCYNHNGVFEADYLRCLKRRGCSDASHRPSRRHSHFHPPRRSRPVNRCGKIKRHCSAEWGRGTRDYYGCLKFHGCSRKRYRRRYR